MWCNNGVDQCHLDHFHGDICPSRPRFISVSRSGTEAAVADLMQMHERCGGTRSRQGVSRGVLEVCSVLRSGVRIGSRRATEPGDDSDRGPGPRVEQGLESEGWLRLLAPEGAMEAGDAGVGGGGGGKSPGGKSARLFVEPPSPALVDPWLWLCDVHLRRSRDEETHSWFYALREVRDLLQHINGNTAMAQPRPLQGTCADGISRAGGSGEA